jgi:hypothetical protein
MSRLYRGFNHGAMTEMNTVKNSDRQVQRPRDEPHIAQSLELNRITHGRDVGCTVTRVERKLTSFSGLPLCRLDRP